MGPPKSPEKSRIRRRSDESGQGRSVETAALVTTTKAFAAPLLALFLGALSAPAHALAVEPDATEDKAETIEAVDVKLQIKAGKKEIGKLTGLVAWEQPAELAMHVDGVQHVTRLQVRKSGAGKLEVKLGYLRGGEMVLETLEVAAASRQKVVKSSDGKIAIALTLAPKHVTADQLPAAPAHKHRIDLPTDSLDPLAGLD